MAESTKIVFSAELFEAHLMSERNARDELEKMEKTLREFLTGRVGVIAEQDKDLIRIDMNLYNSARDRAALETVLQASLLANIEATGEDVPRIADQWAAFAKTKGFERAWWEPFTKEYAQGILNGREEQKRRSAEINARVEQDRANAPKRTAGFGAPAKPINTDFEDDDLV